MADATRISVAMADRVKPAFINAEIWYRCSWGQLDVMSHKRSFDWTI